MRSFNRLLFAIVVLFSVALGVCARDTSPKTAHPPAATEAGIAIYFSPDGGCTDAILARLNGAKKTIDMQAYSFTSTPIAEAMGKAKDRGVKVRMIGDDGESGKKYSAATYLANHGVEAYTDSKHAIAHNKIILIDGETIITGSFNFSKAAEESNAENLVIIDGKKLLYAAYAKNFAEHLKHSEKHAASLKE